jgi:hypothetical protein
LHKKGKIFSKKGASNERGENKRKKARELRESAETASNEQQEDL